MSKEDYFEKLILGIPTKNTRLKELQEKARSRNGGLKGDEVYEFMHLDRYELKKEIAELKEELRRDKKGVKTRA